MNWEINVGSLLIVASVIFSAGGFYWVSKGDNKRMKDDITDIKADLKKLNEVVVNVALQNQRLDNQADRITLLEKRFESRWDELRRGEGLIEKRG